MDLRASRRFLSVPRKNSPSVRTESAAAPADSSEVARATGSKGSRKTPREGEAGFNSARTLMPGRKSAAGKSRSGVAAATPYLSAVSGKTCLRCSTSARRASRIRSSTVPVVTGVCIGVSYHAKECRNESQTADGKMTSYSVQYGKLLEEIAKEADAIALRYFRAADLEIERKRDGSRVTQADKEVETMARARVAASGLALDVLGEEMGGGGANAPAGERARMIIDPIDGTEEFSRGIPTFGTLIGIEENGEIVAGMVSAPALSQGTRWCAYRGEGAFRDGKKIHVSGTKTLAESMIFTTGTG